MRRGRQANRIALTTVRTDDTDFDRWVLRPEQRHHAVLRLLCVPYAGGGPAAYHGWSALLPPSVELWVLRLPGHDARLREPLRTDLHELVREAAAGCAEQLGEPFAVFGHSLGAFIGFELAVELRRAFGLHAAHLAVSARAAPHLSRHHGATHLLADNEFLHAMQVRFQAIPPEILDDRELKALYLPILRADTRMLETYRYQPEMPPLRCPITAFGGTADSDCDERGLRAWQEHTTGGFALTMLRGGHFFLRSERTRLVEALSQELLRSLVP